MSEYKNEPLVSIVMITYNHEKYIREAIRSVTIQKTKFPIELIIANDNSTDETDKIVRKILKNSAIPENIEIKYTRHKVNKGMNPNFYWALERARGKYIALCEGDDYWTDPLKLQKQVDFLEENEECSLCAHNTKIIFEDSNKTAVLFTKSYSVKSKSGNKNKFEIEDAFGKIIYHTSSVLLRNNNSKLKAFTKLSIDLVAGDNLLMAIAASYGYIYMLDDVMSVYRKNEKSVTFSSKYFLNLKYFFKSRILLYSRLNEYFDFKYDDILSPRISLFETKLHNYYLYLWGQKKSFYTLYEMIINNGIILTSKFVITDVINFIKKKMK